MVAVDYSDVYGSYDAAKANVTVKITEKSGKETILAADDSVAATNSFPENCVGFKYTTLPAKGIGDLLTIQAYAGDEESGDSITYSILEYAVKAKSEYPENKALCYAIDAMLELGAEAQKAFEHDSDYPLYDEDGLVDYGMLIVYGGATRKIFGKVGSSLIPEASASVGANPALYTTSYDAVANNSVKVESGVSKYFYVGDSTRTIVNLDMDTYTGETKTTRLYYDTVAGKIACGYVCVYSDKNGNVTTSAPTGTNNVDYAVFEAAGNATAAKPDFGYTVIEPGAYTVVTGENGGFNFNFGNRSDLSMDEYTVSITMKAPNGLKSLGGNNKSVSNQTNPPRFRNGYLWFNLWGMSGTKVNLGTADSGVTLGSYTNKEFVTFHVVVDTKAGTFTGYDQDGNCVGSVDMTVGKGVYNANYATRYEDVFNADPKTFFSHGDTYINGSYSVANKAIVFNRFTITKGNIFK